jgi:hypothetical protein
LLFLFIINKVTEIVENIDLPFPGLKYLQSEWNDNTCDQYEERPTFLNSNDDHTNLGLERIYVILVYYYHLIIKAFNFYINIHHFMLIL